MDLAQEIKDRVRISDVLALYHLEPGRAGFIHCPFHSGDRDASLKVYPQQNSWHCFGCGKGGSVIDFVMEMERIGLHEALIHLDYQYNLGLIKDNLNRREEEKRRKAATERERARQKAELENKAKHEELKQMVLERRQLWLELKRVEPQNHAEAQRQTEMLAKIEYLDCLIEEVSEEIGGA